ncbi:MAG: heterodisulfide reductase-related iron-sulfur binding cluster [Halobacteriota archaeon]|nr:heterodisulfide reductase-related iron-sulfur binding cluster [Halobacteriota archaeon]
MVKTESKEYSLFTGCLIPSRFPFIEIASRKVLEFFDLELHDIEGAYCCPNQMAIQSSSKDLWHALAARNLCLAEEMGHDIVSLCNGCYDTLKSVNSRLKSDDKFRGRTNEMLADFGLEFNGSIDVKHIVQVLHDDVGPGAIENALTNPLQKLKCASFEGCHVKRPTDHMGFDDPNNPYYLEDLIRMIGGDVVSYSEQQSCCGGGLSIGRKDDVVPFARRVLRSVLDIGGRAIVVNCPFCFTQFYRSEREINEIYSEDLHLPVFYITQLIGLAVGLSPEEIGMPMHYENSVGGEEELVKEILSEKMYERTFTDEVTKSQLELCAKCLACADDCPTAMTTSMFHPEVILELVIEGRIDEALLRDDLWYCMNCHECVQRCPQGFGMAKLIIRLKNLAIAKGICPEVINSRMSDLFETGHSFAPNLGIREDMGLPEMKEPNLKELKKLIEIATTEESKDRGN